MYASSCTIKDLMHPDGDDEDDGSGGGGGGVGGGGGEGEDDYIGSNSGVVYLLTLFWGLPG